jgi:hypothetical protein
MLRWVSLCGLIAALVLSAGAQTAVPDATAIAGAASTAQFARWTGSLPAAAGKTAELSFALYPESSGGVALWSEKQSVKVGSDGSYSVLLGATSAEGLAKSLFPAGEQRWMEVRLVSVLGSVAA